MNQRELILNVKLNGSAFQSSSNSLYLLNYKNVESKRVKVYCTFFFQTVKYIKRINISKQY